MYTVSWLLQSLPYKKYFTLIIFYLHDFFQNVAYLFVFDSVEAHDAFWSDISFSIAEASSMKRSYICNEVT